MFWLGSPEAWLNQRMVHAIHAAQSVLVYCSDSIVYAQCMDWPVKNLLTTQRMSVFRRAVVGCEVLRTASMAKSDGYRLGRELSRLL